MLDRLAGNEALKADLSAALAAGRLAHALLLVGEPGCGAGFAARCLAADYLYPAGGPHAEAVLREEDAECISLRGEGASGQIPVAKIRAARENIQHSALSADAAGRVLFIYGAQNLNGSSANAMLKILEEPPEGVLFLLTATSAATVLPTIRSRCALHTVSPVSRLCCAAALCAAQKNLPPAQAEDLAFLYEGHIGSALAAVADEETKTALHTAQSLCQAAEKGDTFQALSLLAGAEKDRAAARALLRQASYLASGALRRPGFGGLSAPRAARLLNAAEDAARALKGNGNLKLLLTVFGAAVTA
ncbi:MAG: hypothetical protein PHO10_08905 [Gemmiger sp.]|nr:hypothetical protein [Gemmiger sp.]